MCQICETLTSRAMPTLSRRRVLGASAAMIAIPAIGSPSHRLQALAQTPAAGIPGRGWGFTAANEPLHPVEFTMRAMNADDVLIEIMYSGVCHSDVHSGRDWAMPGMEMLTVPGHEIIGRVAEVGDAVTTFQVGDIAGVGTMINSCGTCENCLRGLEQYCLVGATWTYGGMPGGPANYGGYADRIVVRDHFAYQIPTGMDLPSAAPLLCAGITTYSPIQHWNVQPGMKTGVVGLGGLGHLALKRLVDLETDVTVFTTTSEKQPDAISMGATNAVVWGEDETDALNEFAGQLDFLIVTIPYSYNVDLLTPLLKLDGTLVNLGVLGGVEGLNMGTLLFSRRSVAASNVGGVPETQAMLDHYAAHDIRPEVEIIAMDQINEAWDRVVNKDVRYRFVIDMSTL